MTLDQKWVSEAREILQTLGLSRPKTMACFVLRVLCGLKPGEDWVTASKPLLTVSKDIMARIRDDYGVKYAENTRESIRKDGLRPLKAAGVVIANADDPARSTNSQHFNYSLDQSAVQMIRAYGSPAWKKRAVAYRMARGLGLEIQQRRRAREQINVLLPDKTITRLSPGRHNQLQAAILEEFVPQFVPDGQLLYLGDTNDRALFEDRVTLKKLGIALSTQRSLPDVVIYRSKLNQLVLVEAVVTGGSVSDARLIELEHLLSKCKCSRKFVTAFESLSDFRKFIDRIAWDTYVWIAELHDHLIHYNGSKL